MGLFKFKDNLYSNKLTLKVLIVTVAQTIHMKHQALFSLKNNIAQKKHKMS